MIDRGVRKNQYIGGCLKRGAWTVCRFKGEGEGEGAWQERRVGFFLREIRGVDTPMDTMAGKSREA